MLKPGLFLFSKGCAWWCPLETVGGNKNVCYFYTIVLGVLYSKKKSGKTNINVARIKQLNRLFFFLMNLFVLFYLSTVDKFHFLYTKKHHDLSPSDQRLRAQYRDTHENTVQLFITKIYNQKKKKKTQRLVYLKKKFIKKRKS